MLPIGNTRYIDFRLADENGNPVAGRSLSSFQIVLRRNLQPCTDALALQDYGDGTYTVSYLPSAPGHDYFMLYDAVLDIRVIDNEDVLPADFAVGGTSVSVTLNQDYGGTDALRATGLSDNPSTYQLLVFLASDWDGNRRADANALGITGLDSSGRWLAGIPVIPGTYDIVVRKSGQTNVIAYNIEVSNG